MVEEAIEIVQETGAETQVIEGGPVVTEVEEKARSQGWVPLEEFRGDPNQWRDAKTFVERGEIIIPIMKERNEKLERKLHDMEGSVKELVEFSKKAEERAYQRARNDLEVKRLMAVENADTEAFREAERELDSLQKQKEAAAPARGFEEPPEMKAFRQTNGSWYDVDPDMTAEADALGIAYAKQGLPYGKILEKVQDRIKALHPAKFANARREQASAVEFSNDTGLPRKSSTKDYAHLPADAKAQCDKFIRDIRGFTKDDYVNNYEWE